MVTNRRILEELQRKEEKIPLMINMIAKRVRQIFHGDKPMIENSHSVDAVGIAIKEFLDGKLEVRRQPESK